MAPGVLGKGKGDVRRKPSERLKALGYVKLKLRRKFWAGAAGTGI